MLFFMIQVPIVMSLITAIFPSIFEVIGLLEKYHPRVTLRWQLARILALYFLNLYTLVIALYNKVEIMVIKFYSNFECLSDHFSSLRSSSSSSSSV